MSRTRRQLLNKFKQKQIIFDKSFHNTKWKFEQEKRINIEKLKTENPQNVCSVLNKLRPRKIL